MRKMVVIGHLFPKKNCYPENIIWYFFPAINIFSKRKENSSIVEFVTQGFQVTLVYVFCEMSKLTENFRKSEGYI